MSTILRALAVLCFAVALLAALRTPHVTNWLGWIAGGLLAEALAGFAWPNYFHRP